MNDHLHDRGERFFQFWSHWYSIFVTAILRVAARLLPRRAYGAVEKFAVEQPSRRVVGRMAQPQREGRWRYFAMAGPWLIGSAAQLNVQGSD